MTQTVDVQGGDHNTVVQIDGNGNTVVLGQPHLRLTRFEAERNKPQTDARLLIPARRAIPLMGRDEDLTALLDFVQPDAPNDIRVRVLVGGGGSGKTRLALELCDRIKDTWLVGFATKEELKRFFKQQNSRDWGWHKPTLIVLDYASAQAEVLQEWLPELQDRATALQHPLRILLLERHADLKSGWHQRVFNPGGWQSAGLRDLLDPPEPVRIRPLVEVADRMGVVNAVLRLVRPELMPQVTPDLLNDQLQQNTWGGDPLYLAMAALTMAQRGDVFALKLGRADLALEVAGHELSRLAQAARGRGLHPDMVQHMAACTTLLQGLPRADLLDLIRAEKGPIGFDQGDPATVVEVLHDCLAEGEHIAAVQPDLIGEALLLRAWSKPERAAAIARLFTGHAHRVLETLVRLVQDFSDADAKPCAWFESLLEDHWDDTDALQRIEGMLPSRTVALSDITLRLAKRLLELGSNLGPPEVALRWAKLAAAYSKVGQFDPALDAAKRAEELFRDLASKTPDLFSAAWAYSLDNLAARHIALGQFEIALRLSQLAADRYGDLAKSMPQVYKRDWATSLSNLAVMRRALGQYESALQAERIAEGLLCGLAQLHPDIYLPDWARSLNNLFDLLSEVGQHDDAFLAVKKATELRYALAHQWPDAYMPDLATSLHNLAIARSRVGQKEAALDAAKQAVDLRRELESLRPGLFTACYACSLGNLANRMRDLGRHNDALSIGQQSSDLYRSLASERPDLHISDWAMSLTNLAGMLSAVGQDDAALQAAQQAADLYCELARQRPDAHTPKWAASLTNLAGMLSAEGQADPALQAAQQAADLYRELARQRPDAYTPDWAMSLNNLGTMLSAVGQHEAALQAAQQAADLYRELARRRPDTYTPDWARSLNNLANMLSAVGHREATLQAAQQAADLLRELARQRPDAHTKDYGVSLMVLALRHSDCGFATEAAGFASQALETVTTVFLKRPAALHGLMMAVLKEYLRLSQAAQLEPDMQVLEPLLPFLQLPSQEPSDD